MKFSFRLVTKKKNNCQVLGYSSLDKVARILGCIGLFSWEIRLSEMNVSNTYFTSCKVNGLDISWKNSARVLFHIVSRHRRYIFVQFPSIGVVHAF